MNAPVIEKVIEQLQTLPIEMQQRVLAFTRALAQTAPQGVPGRKLLRFAGTIPLEDVQLMQEAIEQGCEQVDTQSGMQALLFSTT